MEIDPGGQAVNISQPKVVGGFKLTARWAKDGAHFAKLSHAARWSE